MGENPFLGELFLNGRFDSVKNTKNYGAVCELPLAHGHDTQKKIKKKKKGEGKHFLSFCSFRRAQKLCLLQVPRFFVELQQPTQM